MGPLHERLADARDRLVRAGISKDEAALDAEVLARQVLNCDRATLLTRARDPLPSAFGRLYEGLVQRRLAREPIAYIVGNREFWGLEFEVTPPAWQAPGEWWALIRVACAGELLYSPAVKVVVS